MSTDEDNLINRKGLKKQGQPSIFDNKPKKPTQQEFDQKVNDVVNKSEYYSNMGADLAIKYATLIKDKTLPINKSLIVSDLEKEITNNFVKYAEEFNNDENEKEGMGSLSIISVVKMFAIPT
jgi:hypothetical protein